MGGRKSKLISPITILTPERITQICHRTNLSVDEVRCRYSAFLQEYPHGLITREQFYENLVEVWPEGQIEKFASHLFAIL